MLFNTLNFSFFLPVTFILYWSVSKKSLNIQNLIVLSASYFFYACWDWRFLFLLIFSTFLDYFSGIKIEESGNQKTKKRWFWFSILMNLSFLGFFKYYNFFIDSFTELISLIGFKVNFWTLKVLLPVGISFYTFHGLSYMIDIYKGRIKSEKNLISYSVFVCFFPLLVAGPIERASHLLPQINFKRNFDIEKAINGLKQILWGLFKKVVIADNCATIVNQMFDNYQIMGGGNLALGAVLFSVQVYCDFSGYSDIALGVARLFGFELMKNFNYPFLSRSITEFWRRWHISLSTWFNDYLFTPMIIKWRNSGTEGIYVALLITFLLSGLWHGAGWNFIIYGLLHGILLVFEMYTKKRRKSFLSRFNKTFISVIAQVLTFSFVTFAFIFFRAENVNHAILYIKQMCSGLTYIWGYFQVGGKIYYDIGLLFSVLILLFFYIEWKARDYDFAFENFGLKWNRFVRLIIYYLIVFFLFWYSGEEKQFIYFQF